MLREKAQTSFSLAMISQSSSKPLSTPRRCHRTIMQNFVGTLIVDSIGVGLAAFGFLNPLLAAFIHVSSELTFILNSARLLPPVSSAHGLMAELFSGSSAVAQDYRRTHV